MKSGIIMPALSKFSCPRSSRYPKQHYHKDVSPTIILSVVTLCEDLLYVCHCQEFDKRELEGNCFICLGILLTFSGFTDAKYNCMYDIVGQSSK